MTADGYTSLPAPHAAAWARLTAIARAHKAAGAGGGLDYLRSHACLGRPDRAGRPDVR